MGGIYEVDKNSGGTVTGTKTYYPAAGAMRVGGTLYFILKDHLGSASVVTDGTGTIVGEDRFYPFGETRFTTGTMYTDRLFTGQREITGLGIYYFNARFYSPKLGRFLSPDTMIPGYANPQTWNRYSYVANRPINLTDPTGHRCDPEDDCGGPHYSSSDQIHNWKWRIKHKYGITMSDNGNKTWSATNLSLMYSSLETIDSALNGALSSLVGGATIYLSEHHPDADHPNSAYHGVTSGLTITFYTIGTQALHQMNIFHEFGHLVDNGHRIANVFSNALGNLDHPTFRTADGILDTQALTNELVDDPNYGQHVEAIQHESTGAIEQWADIFANYVAGNINMATIQGQDMNSFVNGAFDPYISAPTRYEMK